MRFADALAARRFAVALEITPPRASLPRVLQRRASLLGGAASAVNVIQRPDRQSSLDASCELRETGLDPVWHLVTRGRTAADLRPDLVRAAGAGLAQVLCIRGDHESAGESVTVREAIAHAREAMPTALIGATLNQYVADRAAVLRNLHPKLAAGATYVQTQPVFDLDALRPLVEVMRERVPDTRVVAMAMPLITVEAFERIEGRLGVELPAALRDRIERGGEDEGWLAFDETVAALAGCGFVDGLAVMTFEMDPAPEAGARIVAALRAAGIAPAPVE